jgi:hypothetical protein
MFQQPLNLSLQKGICFAFALFVIPEGDLRLPLPFVCHPRRGSAVAFVLLFVIPEGGPRLPLPFVCHPRRGSAVAFVLAVTPESIAPANP